MDSIDVIKPPLSTALISSAVDKPWQKRQLENKLLERQESKLGQLGQEVQTQSTALCPPPPLIGMESISSHRFGAGLLTQSESFGEQA